MRYLLLSIIVSVFLGCGGTVPKATNIVYPSWYLNPPQNSSTALYGVGEGQTLQMAKASALSAVAESLSLSIRSELRKSETSRRYNGDESAYTLVQSTLDTHTKAIEFSDYSIMKHQQVGSKILLLVEVSREKLFADQKSKLDQLFLQLSEEKKHISQYPRLKRVTLYEDMSERLQRLRSMALVCKSINRLFEIQRYEGLISAITDMKESVLQDVRVSISAPREAMIFANALKEGLNSAKIKVVNKGANTRLTLTSAFAYDEIYGFKSVKVTLAVSLEEKGRDFASDTLIISGRSRYDYEKAIYNAAHLLKKRIKDEGILTLLAVR